LTSKQTLLKTSAFAVVAWLAITPLFAVRGEQRRSRTI